MGTGLAYEYDDRLDWKAVYRRLHFGLVCVAGAPARGRRGLYTRVLGKLAGSGQIISFEAAQAHAAGGVATILEKMK